MGEHNRSHGSWCPQNGYKDCGSGRDDFEMCLELELTKGSQGSQVTEPVNWYF
jgi:hypothetical protein